VALFRAYSIGIATAMFFFMIGALIYTRHEDLQTFGAKIMVGMGVILLSIIWPISGPAAVGYAVKTITTYIVRVLSRETDEKLS